MKIVLEAQNIRFLATKIRFADLKPKVRTYWLTEYEGLLLLTAELCSKASKHSLRYHNYTAEDFGALWKYNPSVNMTHCPDVSDIVSHHTTSTGRLKSAIMSGSPCLSEAGPIIDKLKDKILLNSRLLQSFYL